MRAVWSFWSKPFCTYYSHVWAKPLHHLLAWGLSFDAAARHYLETMLVTDRIGKRLLIDQLGLPFTHVSTDLEALHHVDSGWWALGKLLACSLQDRPFVHLDNDVFLWKALPRDLLQSPVIAQCPYSFNRNHPHFRPQEIELAFAQEGLTLPAEWIWARTNRNDFAAANGGVLGGSGVDFLRYYAQSALELVLKPENGPAWSHIANKQWPYVLLEEFFLLACVEYHNSQADSPYRGVKMSYVFPSWEHAYDPNRALRVGYTHLMGAAKSHPAVGLRIEERVRRQDPAYYRRCEQVLAKNVLPI
jgi:hypothetical protein